MASFRFILLILLAAGGFIKAQTKSYTLPSSILNVNAIRVIDTNTLELELNVRTPDHPSRYSMGMIGRLYLKEDSLGPLFYNDLIDGRYRKDTMHLSKDVRLIYRSGVETCTDFYQLNLQLIDFNNPDRRLNLDRHFSASFNPIWKNDSLIFYGADYLCDDDFDGYVAVDSLFRCWIDIENNRIQYLDTFALPFILEGIGSLINDVENDQEILIYDQKKIHFNPKAHKIDSVTDAPDFPSHLIGNQSDHLARSVSRHFFALAYSNGQSYLKRQVYDSLNYYRVDYRADWRGREWRVLIPKAPNFEAKFWNILEYWGSDSVLTIGLFQRLGPNENIRLFRFKDEQLINENFHAAPLESGPMAYYALASDDKGVIYLAASTRTSTINKQIETFILRIEPDKSMEAPKAEDDFRVFYYPNYYNRQKSIYFVHNNIDHYFDYEVLGINGEIYSSGRARSRDRIELKYASRGHYFLKLSIEGRGLGIRRFLVE